MYWFIAKSILGSIIGSSFYNWFKNTKVGVWVQSSLNSYMEYVSEKYDITLTTREEAWLKQYPNLAKRIADLEANYTKLK
jgi:hypothetical protein|tara:strand:- start:199 stop:438 length:240 start_codon:yes stop_codon:yes gene_type:complete